MNHKITTHIILVLLFVTLVVCIYIKIPKAIYRNYIGYVVEYSHSKHFISYNSKLDIRIEGKKINSLLIDDTFEGIIEIGSIKYNAILFKGRNADTKKVFYYGDLKKDNNTMPIVIKISYDFNDLWMIGSDTDTGFYAVLASSTNKFEDCKDNIYKIDGK